MSSSGPPYLVTEIDTERIPPRMVKQHSCPDRTTAVALVTRLLTAHLNFHASLGASPEVQHDVEDARQLVQWWERGPHVHLRLCGQRYFVDPVSAGWVGVPTWLEMRHVEQLYVRGQLRAQVPDLSMSDPVYEVAANWVAAAPYTENEPANKRAWTMGVAWELGVRLVQQDMNLRPPTDTLASWMLRCARVATRHDLPVETVGEVLRAAEAAERRPTAEPRHRAKAW